MTAGFRSFALRYRIRKFENSAGTNYKTTISGTKGWVNPQRRHRIGACLFFRRKLGKRFRREVIGNVSISIHELLAVARGIGRCEGSEEVMPYCVSNA